MLADKLGEQELQDFMVLHDIAGEIVHPGASTPTVETAALAVGTSVDQILKSILFLVDEHPILAIACGLANIERRAIADLFAVGKKRVKLASREVVLAVTGYEVGAMPPFGHRQPLETLMEGKILEYTEVYAGGGAENALLRLDPHEILRVTAARVLHLLE